MMLRRSQAALILFALAAFLLGVFTIKAGAQAPAPITSPAALGTAAASGPGVPIRDLVIMDGGVPVRLMGYGIVVGLPNTGDRTSGNGSRETVQSVANVLRRFNVIVPPELLRTRNAAAVLVTAEVSPFLRAGGRFEIQVSSIGDARSLRGGTLWMTPLVTDPNGPALASAQGAVLLPLDAHRRTTVYSSLNGSPETSARIPNGGVLEGDLPRPAFAGDDARLTLREPDLGTAARIAAAIDAAMGAGSARVEDPGSIALTLKNAAGSADTTRAGLLSRVAELRVPLDRPGRIVIDARAGTVVAGGDMAVSAAAVSVDGISLTIGASVVDTLPGSGQVALPAGTTVQRIVAALHSAQTPPAQIAAIFEALRQVGAMSGEVVVR